jgi:hypothetical protein
VEVWKLLLSTKVCIFVLYCCVGKMTREFPLSADVTALFSWSLFLWNVKSCIQSGGLVL